VQGDTRTLQQKVLKAFWRGSDTGGSWDPALHVPHNRRRTLVERWGLHADSRVDVGFNAIRQQ
jgi:hypothetical protein